MKDNTWAIDFESKFFSLLEARFFIALIEKYPNLNVTLLDSDLVNPQFPTIYLKFFLSELGKDISQTGINAISCTIQIETYLSKEQGFSADSEINGIVTSVLKEYGFEFTSIPELNNNSLDVIRRVSRCRRVIGVEDLIFNE